jgi:hypothetical protein
MGPNLTKSIPLNPAHQIFPTTPKAHLNSSEVFSYDLISSEKIIQYSRTFAPQVQMSWN